ncbi:MAG: hypothetical protein R3D25_06185 [Geminicoccaceae bacterium]
MAIAAMTVPGRGMRAGFVRRHVGRRMTAEQPEEPGRTAGDTQEQHQPDAAEEQELLLARPRLSLSLDFARRLFGHARIRPRQLSRPPL